MNRGELLQMLEQLGKVPSVELKMNVPTDQRMALVGLGLDAMEGRLREVFFFDTPDLTLYHGGVVVRARRTQGADDDTVVKLRPAAPEALSPAAGLQEPQARDGRDPRFLRGVGLAEGKPARRRGP